MAGSATGVARVIVRPACGGTAVAGGCSATAPAATFPAAPLVVTATPGSRSTATLSSPPVATTGPTNVNGTGLRAITVVVPGSCAAGRDDGFVWPALSPVLVAGL